MAEKQHPLWMFENASRASLSRNTTESQSYSSKDSDMRSGKDVLRMLYSRGASRERSRADTH